MIQLADLPRFLLYTEAGLEAFRGQTLGHWRFVLQSLDNACRFDASDWEPDVPLERLELLTVVRGLEELDQSSSVTIVTASRYVAHGFDFGLREWRQSGWRWERFGDLVPISNDDLWRRLDRASRVHRLQHRPAERAPGIIERAGSDAFPKRAEANPRMANWGRWMRQLSRVASSMIPI